MKFDIASHIGATSRYVKDREVDGKTARVVLLVRTFDTTVEDVWDAVTNPECLPRWFLPVTGDLRLGGRYQLEGNAGGTITRCDAPSRLAMTWEFGGGISWVEVRIAPDPSGGARLELEHIAHEDAHWKEYGPGAAGVGWDLAIGLGLAQHLATKAAVDHQAQEAWSRSDEGKSFIRKSSAAWAKAAIAAGTDQKIALAAETRTSAFYTGESSS